MTEKIRQKECTLFGICLTIGINISLTPESAMLGSNRSSARKMREGYNMTSREKCTHVKKLKLAYDSHKRLCITRIR